MELVLSVAFGVWFVISGIFYWFITKERKEDKK